MGLAAAVLVLAVALAGRPGPALTTLAASHGTGSVCARSNGTLISTAGPTCPAGTSHASSKRPPAPTGIAPGSTATGVFAASGRNPSTADLPVNQFAYASISFPAPLSRAPTGIYVTDSTPAAQRAHCHGDGAHPSADPGYLCIFDQSGTAAPSLFDPSHTEGTVPGRRGAILAFPVPVAGEVYAYGSWAVTAPKSKSGARAARSDGFDTTEARHPAP